VVKFSGGLRSECVCSDTDREESASAGTAAKAVFVADDTAFVRERFRTAIVAGGHEALTARTGHELLARIRNHGTADLVVLDLRLPGGRGLNLVKALRALDTHPPVVVFSGTIASSAEVRQLGELGVAGYINEYAADQHILPGLAPYLYPDSINQRSSPRLAMGVPVSYRVGNTVAGAVTLTVSRGGLAIRTTSLLEIGAAIRVRFRLPGHPRDVDAGATVVWTDRRVGMGVQFTTIGVNEQTAIAEFVDAHFFSNRKA
jgi:CheY-like chemotaxis protein